MTASGLIALVLMPESPLAAVAMVVFGSNAMLAVLLPYTAELFPARSRGRATGWVASCTKLGGILAQLLGVMGMIPALPRASIAVVALLAIGGALVAMFGGETRGRDLSTIDAMPGYRGG